MSENLCQHDSHSRQVIPYIAFTWYGAILSFQDFIRNVTQAENGVRSLILLSWSSQGVMHQLLLMTSSVQLLLWETRRRAEMSQQA